MNAPFAPSTSRIRHTWLLAILTALMLMGSLVQPGSAQTLTESPTSAGFFNAVSTGSPADPALAGTVLHTPLGTYAGVDGTERFGRDLRESFSHVEFTTNSIETVERLLVVQFTMTAVHSGTFNGLYADCVGITVPGTLIVRFGERMVVTERPESGALGQHIDDGYTVEAYIAEQWFAVSEREIEAQISAYNTIPSYARPSCFSTVAPAAETHTGLPPASDEPVQWGNPW